MILRFFRKAQQEAVQQHDAYIDRLRAQAKAVDQEWFTGRGAYQERLDMRRRYNRLQRRVSDADAPFERQFCIGVRLAGNLVRNAGRAALTKLSR